MASASTIAKDQLVELTRHHGSPLFVMDHEILRANCRLFKTQLPDIQAYYAVKANCDPQVVRTLFEQGFSFDVASYNEFMQVYEFIADYAPTDKDFFIWDKIIFSNTIKDTQTLEKIKRYKPLMTYDNADELKKIKAHCDTAGLVLRLKVPDTGSQVEMGSKFGVEPGDAAELIKQAFDAGLVVEGLSFHVGSQCTHFDNYTTALNITAEIFHDTRRKGYPMNIVDIGGGFPAPYDGGVPAFENLAKIIRSECGRLFDEDVELIAEPGRFIVATAAKLVCEIIGKNCRDGKIFYHVNDGVYHSFSGVIFDHWIPNFQAFKDGPQEICAVVGPTCDSFDKISLAQQLSADLQIGDYLLTENIGAYSIATATRFNGFDGANILHVNQ